MVLALIQIGGFGIMTIGSVLALVTLRRVGLRQRMLAQAEIGAVDIVILAQPAAAAANNHELFRSLANHWRKIAAATNQPQLKMTGSKDTRGTNLDG